MRYFAVGSAIGLLLAAQVWIGPSPHHEAPLRLAVSHSLKEKGDVRLITERSQYMRSER
jgi:hypothetical protein